MSFDEDRACRAIIGKKKEEPLPTFCGQRGELYRGPNSTAGKYLCHEHKPTSPVWFHVPDDVPDAWDPDLLRLAFLVVRSLGKSSTESNVDEHRIFWDKGLEITLDTGVEGLSFSITLTRFANYDDFMTNQKGRTPNIRHGRRDTCPGDHRQRAKLLHRQPETRA